MGTAASLADRFDRLQSYQLGQIAPGCGSAHLGEADGLALHRIHQGAMAGRRSRELLQEPAQPCRDIQIPALAALQCRAVALREKPAGDRPGQAAVGATYCQNTSAKWRFLNW